MRRAVIDVGSNSVLLVVEERRDGVWSSVLETSAVTGLGEGVKTTGRLGEEPMKRTLAAIEIASRTAAAAGAQEVVAAATMAARMAKNTSDFLAAAERQGTPVLVLSGEAEADLGFRAVANDALARNWNQLSIIDVGGQSTELVMARREGDGWKTQFRQSFPVGTLALRGSSLSNERLEPPEILEAVRGIDDLIRRFEPSLSNGHSVVLGATGTNLVTIRDRIVEWDAARVHGAQLTYEEVSQSFAQLARLTDAERAALPGIEPGREGTIHLGALILERFLHAIHAETCWVSVRGWRHALLEEGF